jgi:hypothetical protein
MTARGTWVIVRVIVEDRSPGGVCLPAEHRHDTREGNVYSSGDEVLDLPLGARVVVRTTDVLPLGGGLIATDQKNVIAVKEAT